MKTVECECGNCGKRFDVKLNEYKRQTKKGRTRFFCTRSCAISKNLEEHPRKGNPQFLIADNRRDDYSPFRWFVRRAVYRDKKKHYGCDVTAGYLHALFESQDGLCPFTGWKLILPLDSDSFLTKSPINASLDRIDNFKGYIQGNVRFISLMANIGRGAFSDEQLISFCKDVAKHRD